MTAIKRVEQICIGVRDTAGVDEANPFSFEYVKARIEHALREYEGRFRIIQLPNITKVFYGRDVGYSVERIDLAASVESISATTVRSRLGL
jgi:adenylylsulfate kinase